MSRDMQEIHVYFNDPDLMKVRDFIKGFGTSVQCCGRGQDERGEWYIRLLPYEHMDERDVLKHDAYGIVESVVFVEPEARA